VTPSASDELSYLLVPHTPQTPHHPATSPAAAGSVRPVPHTRAAPGPAPALASDRNPLRSSCVTFGQPQGEHAIFIRGLDLALLDAGGQSKGAPEGAIAAFFSLILSARDGRLARAVPAQAEGLLMARALASLPWRCWWRSPLEVAMRPVGRSSPPR
jgi:hypothetical protein